MPVPGSFDRRRSTDELGDDDDDGMPTTQATPLLPVTNPFSAASVHSARSASAGNMSKGKAPRRYSNGYASRNVRTSTASPQVDVDGGIEAAAPNGPAGMSFCVRFTDGSEDLLDIWVGERESVGQVKRRIRLLRPSLVVDGRPRRLRLIQLGRLLTDGTFLVPYTVQLLSKRAKLVQKATKPNSQALLEGLEAVGREIGVNVRAPSAIATGNSTDKTKDADDAKGKGKERRTEFDGTEVQEDERVWLQCSVGEPMDDEEMLASGEQEKAQAAQITPLQGFDRLRDAGFSEEDITSMRAEFRRNQGVNIEGDDDEHARALEDQWMEGLTGQNEAAASADGLQDRYWTTLLQGVCIGFFVPFLPFFFFRSQAFSRAMSIAIVLGTFINVTFGLLRMFN
ncbi:hypothetical protein OIV83_001466 [Microbotryomycetes sp. JL201]|nr:hypothetical protein OIV83_001466 [Microbotryomycetes sp. JL201]